MAGRCVWGLDDFLIQLKQSFGDWLQFIYQSEGTFIHLFIGPSIPQSDHGEHFW